MDRYSIIFGGVRRTRLTYFVIVTIAGLLTFLDIASEIFLQGTILNKSITALMIVFIFVSDNVVTIRILNFTLKNKRILDGVDNSRSKGTHGISTDGSKSESERATSSNFSSTGPLTHKRNRTQQKKYYLFALLILTILADISSIAIIVITTVVPQLEVYEFYGTALSNATVGLHVVFGWWFMDAFRSFVMDRSG
ncbi:hypothetical protein HK096_004650 [Nowakowskiella sp. JEL0078]|nr:hypothetical protein HK096_004650 [Nowakowskiella sp. JEL0078]